MAKQDYGQLAKEVVNAVGGKENIISVTNCMTRLRFVLKDDSIPNKEQVCSVKGVKGVMNQGGQYQVIIGTQVSEVVKFARKEAGISEDGKTEVNKEDYKVVKKDSLWNRFFKVISGCIMPMIGPMIAGGILKGILVILTTAGVLENTDGTYLILYAASDALLYFMPIIVGFTCGKVFDCNPYTTAAIGAAFIPVLMNNLFSQGSDPINAVLGLTVWALAGVTFGYAIRNKNPEKRSAGFGSMASALCGVTEPAIYSVAVPNMKLFACAWVGGGISGAILGALGGKMYAMGGDGLFRIPAMINPAGLDVSFYGFIGCAALAFAVSAVLAFIVEGKSGKVK